MATINYDVLKNPLLANANYMRQMGMQPIELVSNPPPPGSPEWNYIKQQLTSAGYTGDFSELQQGSGGYRPPTTADMRGPEGWDQYRASTLPSQSPAQRDYITQSPQQGSSAPPSSGFPSSIVGLSGVTRQVNAQGQVLGDDGQPMRDANGVLTIGPGGMYSGGKLAYGLQNGKVTQLPQQGGSGSMYEGGNPNFDESSGGGRFYNPQQAVPMGPLPQLVNSGAGFNPLQGQYGYSPYQNQPQRQPGTQGGGLLGGGMQGAPLGQYTGGYQGGAAGSGGGRNVFGFNPMNNFFSNYWGGGQQQPQYQPQQYGQQMPQYGSMPLWQQLGARAPLPGSPPVDPNNPWVDTMPKIVG